VAVFFFHLYSTFSKQQNQIQRSTIWSLSGHLTVCLNILSKNLINANWHKALRSGCRGLPPGPAACSSPKLLHQLAGALRFPAGRLQQRLPKRMPAFLLTRLCPLQAAEVLVFLLKVSAKLGHPGAPTLRIIVTWPGKGRKRVKHTLERRQGWGRWLHAQV
jgi:hypothetical protein